MGNSHPKRCIVCAQMLTMYMPHPHEGHTLQNLIDIHEFSVFEPLNHFFPINAIFSIARSIYPYDGSPVTPFGSKIIMCHWHTHHTLPRFFGGLIYVRTYTVTVPVLRLDHPVSKLGSVIPALSSRPIKHLQLQYGDFEFLTANQ